MMAETDQTLEQPSNAGGDLPSGERRRLVKGALAAPVAFTLASGVAHAQSSSNCAGKALPVDLFNGATPTIPLHTAATDGWTRLESSESPDSHIIDSTNYDIIALDNGTILVDYSNRGSTTDWRDENGASWSIFLDGTVPDFNTAGSIPPDPANDIARKNDLSTSSGVASLNGSNARFLLAQAPISGSPAQCNTGSTVVVSSSTWDNATGSGFAAGADKPISASCVTSCV